MDFSRAENDTIDLSAIDANTGAAGDQKFKFIGEAAFSGAARELGYAVSGANLQVRGDVDGDGKADFTILVRGVASLAAVDFVL